MRACTHLGHVSFCQWLRPISGRIPCIAESARAGSRNKAGAAGNSLRQPRVYSPRLTTGQGRLFRRPRQRRGLSPLPPKPTGDAAAIGPNAVICRSRCSLHKCKLRRTCNCRRKSSYMRPRHARSSVPKRLTNRPAQRRPIRETPPTVSICESWLILLCNKLKQRRFDAQVHTQASSFQPYAQEFLQRSGGRPYISRRPKRSKPLPSDVRRAQMVDCDRPRPFGQPPKILARRQKRSLLRGSAAARRRSSAADRVGLSRIAARTNVVADLLPARRTGFAFETVRHIATAGSDRAGHRLHQQNTDQNHRGCDVHGFNSCVARPAQT